MGWPRQLRTARGQRQNRKESFLSAASRSSSFQAGFPNGPLVWIPGAIATVLPQKATPMVMMAPGETPSSAGGQVKEKMNRAHEKAIGNIGLQRNGRCLRSTDGPRRLGSRDQRILRYRTLRLRGSVSNPGMCPDMASVTSSNCLRVSRASNSYSAITLRIVICSSLSVRSDWLSEESIQSVPSLEFPRTETMGCQAPPDHITIRLNSASGVYPSAFS